MSGDGPIIGAVYEKKLRDRTFRYAIEAARTSWDTWHEAVMQEKADVARYQRVVLLKAMDDAMRASGMDPEPGKYREGEE